MSDTNSWVNGEPCDSISLHDRGLLYGHTVFETIKVRGGQACLLDLHLERLALACAALSIPLDLATAESEVIRFCTNLDQKVVRLTISIGSGGRGYLTPLQPKPVRILTQHPLPEHALRLQETLKKGARIGVSPIALSSQPALAGIKHGNRLEQILIRQSWQPSWEEALVFDQDKRLIEGTQSNVFLRKNNSIITPALNDAGVAGVMRQFILNNPTTSKLMITQGQVTPTDIAFADELVLCNSVMGAWPVAEIIGNDLVGDKTFDRNEFKLTLLLTQLINQHGAI